MNPFDPRNSSDMKAARSEMMDELFSELLIPIAQALPKVTFTCNGLEIIARGEPDPQKSAPGHEGKCLLMGLMSDQKPETAVELRKLIALFGAKTIKGEAFPLFADPDTIINVDRG